MENDFNTSEWKMIIILGNTEEINVREERAEQIPMTEIRDGSQKEGLRRQDQIQIRNHSE